MENPIKTDDLGVPPFSETPIFTIVTIYLPRCTIKLNRSCRSMYHSHGCVMGFVKRCCMFCRDSTLLARMLDDVHGPRPLLRWRGSCYQNFRSVKLGQGEPLDPCMLYLPTFG